MKLLPDFCQILYIHLTSLHLYDTKLYYTGTNGSFHNFNPLRPPHLKNSSFNQVLQYIAIYMSL